jgi:hypothetical protein
MKAITLWQPWASLIEWKLKTIETRKHNRFKGLVGERVAIHASKRMDEQSFLIVQQYLESRDYNRLFTKLPQGVVVCTAMVEDARWLTPEDADQALCFTSDELFGLVLTDIQSLGPDYPVAKGSQGIWTWRGE